MAEIDLLKGLPKGKRNIKVRETAKSEGTFYERRHIKV